MLNKVLTRVDLPRPDSPVKGLVVWHPSRCRCYKRDGDERTNNHDVEVEAFSHTLAVPLVREVSKTDIASKLSSNDVSAVVHGCRRARNYRLDVSSCLFFR